MRRVVLGLCTAGLAALAFVRLRVIWRDIDAYLAMEDDYCD